MATDPAARESARLQYEHARECEAFFEGCNYPDEARRRRRMAQIYFEEMERAEFGRIADALSQRSLAVALGRGCHPWP